MFIKSPIFSIQSGNFNLFPISRQTQISISFYQKPIQSISISSSHTQIAISCACGGDELGLNTKEDPFSRSDAIFLKVGGMTCGGCAASVKRILESYPQVASATVYIEKEIAVVWTVPEAKDSEHWQQQIGVKLANHLSNCGFKSEIQDKREEECG